MIKLVRFLKKRPDLTREQFKEYWLKNHSKLEHIVIRDSAVKKIVASFMTDKLGKTRTLPFDGFVELYFDSMEDLEAMRASGIPAMMHEDEKNFADLSEEQVRFVTEEYVIAEKP